MTTEELRSIAGQCDSRAAFESSGMTVSALIEAAAVLREYAASLERAEPVAYMTEYFSPDCGPQYEIYKADDMVWRDKSQYTPLYLHPPRSEPPKMTEAEIAEFWPTPKVPDVAFDFARAICDLRDKQWRGEC